MKVAVLNSNYLPLHYIEIKKAMVLIYLGKAEIVKKSQRLMQSAGNIFHVVPKVIRLVKMIKKVFNPRIVYTRTNIFIRDGWTCQYCSKETKKLTLDHVIPSSRGGKSGWDNVVAACGPCNLKKADKLIDEANMPLKREPRRPSILMEINWDDIFGGE